MAKNDNALLLPLKIDLSEFEKSIATADVELQKAMRQMRSQVSDFKLKYDVEIANARASGDSIKALQLESQKLNAVFEAQRQVVESLNLAYRKSIQEKGEDAKATKDLAKQIVYAEKEMQRTKKQLDSLGINFGQKISDGLAGVSPEFAKIRASVSALSSDMSKLGTKWILLGKAIGGIGLGIGAGIVAIKGAEALVSSYKNVALSAANANEEVFQLRESLNSSYREAELLSGAAKIDGVSLQDLGNAMNKLHKQLQKTGDATSTAKMWLEKYDAQLTDGSGKRLNTIEQLKELQKAFLRAEANGEGRDFLSNVLGNSSDKFVHFIRGFDDYMARSEKYIAQEEKDYETAHKIMDLQKERLVVEQQLASVKGNAYLGNSAKIMENEISVLQEQYKWFKENTEIVEEYGKNMLILSQNIGAVNNAWEAFKFEGKSAFAGAINEVLNGLTKFRELQKEFDEKVPNFGAGNMVKSMLGDIFGLEDEMKNISFLPLGNVLNGLGRGIDSINSRKEDIERFSIEKTMMEEVEHMEKMDKEEAENAKRAEAKKVKDYEEAQKKKIEIAEKYNRALKEITGTDYEKEILHLDDKYQAYLKEGMNEVQAKELVEAEKDKINQKYAEKEKAELQKQTQAKIAEINKQQKAQEEAYKKQIEDAKKLRESQMSEAQSDITGNVKFLRYVKKQKEAGTYNEADAKAYYDRLRMKQMGIRQSDIDTYADIGRDKFRDLTNVQERLFGRFAEQPKTEQNTNNITNNISFDNTVVEDVSAMDKLANKVAEILTPAIEQALRGVSNYGY